MEELRRALGEKPVMSVDSPNGRTPPLACTSAALRRCNVSCTPHLHYLPGSGGATAPQTSLVDKDKCVCRKPGKGDTNVIIWILRIVLGS